MNVTKDTVHLLRFKLLASFKNTKENIKLFGEVEADEIYKSINLKGLKKENMPRASKPELLKEQQHKELVVIKFVLLLQ